MQRPLLPRFGDRLYRAREVMEPAVAGTTLPGWQRRRNLIDYVAEQCDRT